MGRAAINFSRVFHHSTPSQRHAQWGTKPQARDLGLTTAPRPGPSAAGFFIAAVVRGARAPLSLGTGRLSETGGGLGPQFTGTGAEGLLASASFAKGGAFAGGIGIMAGAGRRVVYAQN